MNNSVKLFNCLDSNTSQFILTKPSILSLHLIIHLPKDTHSNIIDY